MAGTFRRPVPNDPHPNRRALPEEHFRYLLKRSRQLKMSVDQLILRAIEDSAKLAGEFVSAGHPVKATCECGTPLIVGKSADPDLLQKGFVVCKYCVSDAVRAREDFIREQERKVRELRANGGPARIRPHPAITRG